MTPAATPPEPSYERETYWRRYQPFFPAQWRLTEQTAPAEEWWEGEGLRVHVDRYRADGPLKVIVVHGAGGYSRLLSPLAVALARRGHEAVAPDLPGYGLTRAPARANTWALWVRVLAGLVAAERARDGRPVVLFGASIGGPLSFHAAARAEVAGLVATMLLDPRDPGARAVLGPPWVPGFAVGLLDRMPPALDGLRVPIRLVGNVGAIANDPALVRLIARDRRGGGNRVPLGFLRTFLTAAPPLEPEEFDRCPVLVVHPERDAWTPVEHTRPVLDRLRAPHELVMLGNCGHFPLEEPGVTQLDEALERFLGTLLHTHSM